MSGAPKGWDYIDYIRADGTRERCMAPYPGMPTEKALAWARDTARAEHVEIEVHYMDETSERFPVAAEPTLEHALSEAARWATKASALALEQKRDVMAQDISVAVARLKRALAKVQREKETM